MELQVVGDIDQAEFVERFIATGTPAVLRGMPFDPKRFTPDAFKAQLGDLTSQVYGPLFDLEDLITLEEYIDTYFGQRAEQMPDEMPYVRWYNQLKDIDFDWGDEAFGRLTEFWQKPNCIPDQGLLVPDTSAGTVCPVKDAFPYRAIQVAARGARTQLHRDPFCSDAVVSQFYGVKEAILYHPEREKELTADESDTSYGGFIDVRENDRLKPSVAPDYCGLINPGDMIYIPRGWLHDVLVIEDSISVTWNFVHRSGSAEYLEYLQGSPEKDSELEVLQYFMANRGLSDTTPRGMHARALELL